MRTVLLTVSFLIMGTLMPGYVLAEGTHSMTRCMWLARDGRQCSSQQVGAELFYHPQGPIIGCKAKPGLVSLRGIKGQRHPWVALTFDDGPSAYTVQYLKILSHYRVHAVFFVIGNQISSFPHALQQELQQGHLVGNHSWSHPMLTSSRVDVSSQLSNTQEAINRNSELHTCLMRPPYGAWDKRVQAASAAHSLQLVLWDVDTRDWSRPGIANIVHNALSEARNGSIVLMHDGGGDRSQTLAALPLIIQGLRARGFQIVRLDKLLGIKLQHG